MRFEQVRDVLNHAREFHKRLSEFYRNLADHEETARIKMLLEHIGTHEKSLERGLANFEESASKQVLDTWFQYTQDESTLKLPEAMEIRPHMSVEDVIRIGLELDDRLIELYKDAAESADVPEVREVFNNLLEMQQQDKHHLVRAALEAGDR
jgi:rubrerythrin